MQLLRIDCEDCCCHACLWEIEPRRLHHPDQKVVVPERGLAVVAPAIRFVAAAAVPPRRAIEAAATHPTNETLCLENSLDEHHPSCPKWTLDVATGPGFVPMMHPSHETTVAADAKAIPLAVAAACAEEPTVGGLVRAEVAAASSSASYRHFAKRILLTQKTWMTGEDEQQLASRYSAILQEIQDLKSDLVVGLSLPALKGAHCCQQT